MVKWAILGKCNPARSAAYPASLACLDLSPCILLVMTHLNISFRRLAFSFLFFAVAGGTAVFAQPRTGLAEIPTMNADVRALHYIYFGVGNEWEYAVSHTDKGQQIDPSFLRFSVQSETQNVVGARDFLVQVQVFGETELLRQRNCLYRLQRGRVHVLGVSANGFGDCNYQSPFSQQDVVISRKGESVRVADGVVDVESTGSYQHFWGDQNGDNGSIQFHYADGIGLVRYESRTRGSIMNSNPSDTEWIGTLQYAKVEGIEYGVSEVARRFETNRTLLPLNPEQ